MGLLDLLGIGKKRRQMIEEALAKGAVIIDVRTAEEYNEGHAEGSLNIPLHRITASAGKLKKMNKPLVLCCATGMRSSTATSILRDKGMECYNGCSWKRLC